MNKIFDDHVLNNLSSLPSFTIIEVVDGDIIVYDSYREFEDGNIKNHFYRTTLWTDDKENVTKCYNLNK